MAVPPTDDIRRQSRKNASSPKGDQHRVELQRPCPYSPVVQWQLARVLGTTRDRSEPVLCNHVEAELITIPSARLGHTIVAWINV